MQSYFIPNKDFSFNQLFKYLSVHIVLQALIYMAHSCTFLGFIIESIIRPDPGQINCLLLTSIGTPKDGDIQQPASHDWYVTMT